MKSLFSFSTAQTEKNSQKKLGKTRLVVWWFEVTNKIQNSELGKTYLRSTKLKIFQFSEFQVGKVGADLNVTPLASELVGTLDSTVSLVCSSSAKPILCLWKTPYGHVYTLSQGVFAGQLGFAVWILMMKITLDFDLFLP